MSIVHPQRISNDFVSAPGYERLPDNMQPRIRLVLHHQGRTWVLSSSVESEIEAGLPPDTVPQLRPLELTSVGIALLWQAILLTAVGRATNYLRRIRYRLRKIIT